MEMDQHKKERAMMQAQIDMKREVENKMKRDQTLIA
jgi:hypothetical protein